MKLDLFPFYVILLAVAGYLSVPNIRALRLTLNIILVWGIVKLIGIYLLTDIGSIWYLICAGANYLIFMNAEGLQLEYRAIRVLCVIGMLVQIWAFMTVGHHSHALYWSACNAIQIAQVIVLIGASPTCMLALGHWAVRKKIKLPPWLQRVVLEGLWYVGR